LAHKEIPAMSLSAHLSEIYKLPGVANAVANLINDAPPGPHTWRMRNAWQASDLCKLCINFYHQLQELSLRLCLWPFSLEVGQVLNCKQPLIPKPTVGGNEKYNVLGSGKMVCRSWDALKNDVNGKKKYNIIIYNIIIYKIKLG